jgi:hypothetical protein
VTGAPGKSRLRRWLRRAGVVLAVLAALVVVAFLTIDRWIFVVLDPGRFDPADTPPAPDYASPSSWAALPSMEDGADVALAELPAIDQATAPADVFYVHPTTALGSRWNAPIDDPAVITATTRGGTLIQASAFNACCAVYAPRYRQANGIAFSRPSPDADRATAIAYADVAAAFDAFLARTGRRPFVLASHSQGTFLLARLFKEKIRGGEPARRLVAAYLVGANVRPDSLGDGVAVCATARDTGCVVAWNARAPGYAHNGLEFDASLPDPMAGRICVNPLTWAPGNEPAPASAHHGALFFDTAHPKVLPAFAAARCEGGSLVVTELGELDRDFMSWLLLRSMPRNYHPIEYQLFYVDLRRNASERVQAFLSR